MRNLFVLMCFDKKLLFYAKSIKQGKDTVQETSGNGDAGKKVNYHRGAFDVFTIYAE